MNSNLLILGAGQYSFVVEEIARMENRLDAFGIFSKVNLLDDCPSYDNRVIGTFSDLESFRGHYHYGIVAIGNPSVRREWTLKLLALGYEIPTLIHPKAWFSSSAKLAHGCIVEANAVINANTVVGQATFICAGAVVNHNATVGDFCQIDCNATVPARGLVPDKTKIVTGTVFNC